MALGCGLTPTVLGPIHAVGDQSDRGRVNSMDRAFESLWKFAVTASFAKSRRLALTMIENFPKEFLRHGRITSAIGMRESVASRCGGSSDRGELTWVILEPITDVIEAQSSGHLTIDQGDEMAPGRERSRLLLASVLAGQLGNETCRDVLANGIENGVSILWLGAMWRLFH